MVAGRRTAEQRLKQPMHPGRLEEIAAAHDVGHPLQRIVDDHREMVARRQIAAAEDDVAPHRRRRCAFEWSGAFAEFAPRKIGRRGLAARGACRDGRPLSRRARGGRALRPWRAHGRFRGRAARRRGRVGRPRRARPPSACKSRDRRGPAGPGARAPPRSRRRARSGGAKARESEVPSHARLSTIAASNRGLQRAWSKSSMRRIRRPPSSAARRAFMSAE